MTTLNNFFNICKLKEIKLLISECNKNIKDIKEEIQKTSIYQNRFKRDDLYSEKHYLSQKLTSYLSQLNQIKNKKNSHEKKYQKGIYYIVKESYDIKKEKFIIILNDDNELNFYKLEQIKIDKKIKSSNNYEINKEYFKKIFNKNSSLYINDLAIKVSSVLTKNLEPEMFEIKNMKDSKNLIFSEIPEKKILIENFIKFYNIEEKEINNIEEFYTNVEKYQKLIKIQEKYLKNKIILENEYSQKIKLLESDYLKEKEKIL